MGDGRAANVRRPKRDWRALLIDVTARPGIFGGGNDTLSQERITYHKKKKANHNTNTSAKRPSRNSLNTGREQEMEAREKDSRSNL